MKKIKSRCPVCNHELTRARLKCDSCGTVIEKQFRHSSFDYLPDAKQNYLMFGIILLLTDG